VNAAARSAPGGRGNGPRRQILGSRIDPAAGPSDRRRGGRDAAATLCVSGSFTPSVPTIGISRGLRRSTRLTHFAAIPEMDGIRTGGDGRGTCATNEFIVDEESFRSPLRFYEVESSPAYARSRPSEPAEALDVFGAILPAINHSAVHLNFTRRRRPRI